MMFRILTLSAVCLGLAFAAKKPAEHHKMPVDAKPAATADMKTPQGESAGKVSFFATPQGVLLHADLEGLPAGRHAIHIHETGSCEAPDFESAGDHFNPTAASHGYLSGKNYHAGDMPNFETADDGSATLEVFNDAVTAKEGGKDSLFKNGGTAVVIHSGTDDYRSQPSGDAGDRIACGVIEKN